MKRKVSLVSSVDNSISSPLFALIRKSIFIVITVLLFYPACTVNLQAEPEIFIRLNQVGFLPGDVKTAVLMSNRSLAGKKYEVVNSASGQTIFSGVINSQPVKYGSFNFSYVIDFSPVRESGNYAIKVSRHRSFSFRVADDVYRGIAEALLSFFQLQRCGYTNPFLHAECHIADATAIIENGRKIDQKIDLTGGWHDAGDYVKFLNTTAFATYMLLFSYDFNPAAFSFDKNNNNVADLLEEAKVGLDWMLRAYFDKRKLATQVQDLRDHDVGWRMPEDDPLAFDRPAFVGIGKNLIGIYAATMALASRIWRETLQFPDFADKCLNAAETIYSIRNSVPDIDSSGSGMYVDNEFEGKLALGAIELFLSTNKKEYLTDSKVYADSAGADFWWSWGDINSLVHYRLANFDPKYLDYIKANLDEFNRKKNDNLFGKGVANSWGTNNTLLGITLNNILWKRLTKDSSYDSLAAFQKDFVLGRNSWGISFIYGFGKTFSRNFHHQIAYLKGKLPGGFAAGPASKSFLDAYKIQYEKQDKYSKFQTDDFYYRDDRMDYITNEPTITANATALFVFGNLNGR